MKTETITRQEKKTIQEQLWDIIVEVSWGEISEQYFGKSRSWLSKKMNNKGFNGGEGGFSAGEIETLKGALFALSDRIRRAASSLE